MACNGPIKKYIFHFGSTGNVVNDQITIRINWRAAVDDNADVPLITTEAPCNDVTRPVIPGVSCHG